MTDVLAGGSHPAHSTVNGSPFPPIADYGFLSDCEVCALVAPSGNVEWMCLPRMDGPSVFAGRPRPRRRPFRLGPADVTVPAGRRYLPGTMVLETTWDTPDGWAVVRDVLLVGPWRHQARRSDDAPAGAGRSRRRAGAAADRPVPERVHRLRAGVRAGLRLRPPARRPGVTPGTATARPRRCSAMSRQFRLTTDLNLGLRGSAGDRPPPPAGRRAGVLRAVVGRRRRRRRRSPTRTSGSPATADFWHEWISRGPSPTIPGASTCSGPR